MTLNITALWDALGWAILHNLWQGALIGFIVWVVRALATDRHAWLRYLAGMGGLVATFVAFLTTFMILMLNRAQNWAPVEFAGGTEAGLPTELTLSISVLPVQLAQGDLAAALVPWLGMIWAVGFAFLSLQAYRAYATTRWLATRGLRSPGADWTSRFAVLIKRSRTHSRIRLFVSEHVSGPMTLGALRPIVLVPVGFLTALPPAQIEAILLHELGHIRRHDFLFGLIQTAIRTALYFNPAVIMISRQIDEDREKACDDIAVSISGNPRDLVRGLAALRLGNHAPAMVMAADGGPLLTRLNRLMGRPASRNASSRLTAAAVSALILGTAACSTVSMAHPPEAPDAAIPDTIIRANEGGQSRVFVSNAAPLPPMPAMPAVPATPTMPALPVPVFGDYDSEDAFEDAMETWGETMEVWGEEVERRFEGDWEDRMDVWGEEMEVWGEAVEAVSENHDEQGFEAFAELGALAQLADLSDLAGLSAFQSSFFEDIKVEEKANEIRERVMHRVEASRRRTETAERQTEAERQVEQRQWQLERQQDQAEARQAARSSSETQSSSHSDRTITVSGDDLNNSIVINGRALDVDAFRTQIMTALVEDGLVKTGDRSVKLKLCEGALIVDGQTGSKAQAKRYAKIVEAAGFDLDNSLTFKIKPELLSLTMSGRGQKNGKEISVGTFEHTPSK